jgi:hypothetical protein
MTIASGFEIIYDDDKELYGPPDGTLTVSMTKDLDEWLTTLNSHVLPLLCILLNNC